MLSLRRKAAETASRPESRRLWARVRFWGPVLANMVVGFLFFLFVWGWWAAFGATVLSVVWGLLLSLERAQS